MVILFSLIQLSKKMQEKESRFACICCLATFQKVSRKLIHKSQKTKKQKKSAAAFATSVNTMQQQYFLVSAGALLLGLLMHASATVLPATTKQHSDQCVASDARLQQLWSMWCESFQPDCPGTVNVTAGHDWPSQVTYVNDTLQALTDPETCLNTTYAKQVLGWTLGDTNTTTDAFWNNWMVFQVQYYDMPRVPGARIESPATLGRKCWAFAYLRQIWPDLKPKLEATLSHAGLGSYQPFFDAYDAAIPFTMNLCYEVMANCFVNQTYNPARNGTCPDVEKQFYVGFQVCDDGITACSCLAGWRAPPPVFVACFAFVCLAPHALTDLLWFAAFWCVTVGKRYS